MMEKKIISILFSLCCIFSCSEEEVGSLYTDRPIIFSQELGVTRGGKVTVLNSKSFGVRGYIYDDGWRSRESLAVPDSKWKNMRVECDANGICKYDKVQGEGQTAQNIQNWKANKNYAFFGYYPYKGSAGSDPSGGTVTLSPDDGSFFGSPTLTYRYSDAAVGSAANSWKGDFGAMYDVMWGKVTDANEKETSSVELNFKHALSAIQLYIENLYENTIKIESLYLILNLKYREMTLHMKDGSVEKFGFDGAASEQEVRFDYISLGDPKAEVPSTLNFSPVNVSQGKELLLIPQKGITGSLNIKLEGYEYAASIPVDFTDLDMQPGVVNAFAVQLLGNHNNLIVIEKTGWLDQDSNIEFE